MRIEISHTSTYSYSAPINYGLHQIRLHPQDRPGQTVESWTVELENADVQAEYEDPFDNKTLLARSEAGASSISVRTKGVVETADQVGIVGPHSGHMPLWYFRHLTPLTKIGPRVRALLKSLDKIDDDLERFHALSAATFAAVRYEGGQTVSETTAEQALNAGHGVCQDHAHIFLSAARAMKFPARYVSGYLMMNERAEQEATHAWVEVHIEGLGWVGFDVSNEMSPDERYVGIATGLDYRDAAPIRGLVFGENEETLSVQVCVQQQSQ